MKNAENRTTWSSIRNKNRPEDATLLDGMISGTEFPERTSNKVTGNRAKRCTTRGEHDLRETAEVRKPNSLVWSAVVQHRTNV